MMIDNISVIIPVHNDQYKLVSVIVDLILFIETYPGLIKEVIVVDNCSVDGTIEYLMRYMKKLPLKLICLSKQFSVSCAVKEGIKDIKGDYLLILKDLDKALYILSDLSSVYKNVKLVQ